MKKGISVQTLILALVFMVIVISIFSILFMRSSSQALSKVNDTLPKTDSISHVSKPKSYFGLQLVLPSDEKLAKDMLFNTILDCYKEGVKRKQILFCNYVDASNVKSILIKDVVKNVESTITSIGSSKGISYKDFIEGQRGDPFDRANWDKSDDENYGRLYQPPIDPDIPPAEDYMITSGAVNKFEICCDDDGEVFITPLNQCIKKAKD